MAGHGGKLVFCEFEGRKVVLQAGRFHYYEGHPMPLVVTPMRLYGRLGAKAVLLTNAAGALNPAFGVGELMALTDHINLFGTNPLIGPNVEPGPRFPDMTAIYDLARHVDNELGGEGLHPHPGVCRGGRLDEGDPLLDWEGAGLGGIVQNGDDHLIEERRRAADDVEVAIGHRVIGAGAERA